MLSMNKRHIIIVSILILLLVFAGITTNAYADEEPYKVSGTVITVAVDNGTEISKTLNNAILYAGELNKKNKKIYTVKVPKGTYYLSKVIRVYGNIILDVSDTELYYISESGNMLVLGDKTTNMDETLMRGYGTMGNITVKGGKWYGNDGNRSTMVKIAHSFNVKFEGCTFLEGGCTHQFEVAAVDGFTLKNCKFMDKKDSGTGGKQEAVQFDIPISDNVYSGIIQDGTPMKNVLVTGCVFENMQRGIGTHTMLLGQYHKNMVFKNNTFKNMTAECIVALNYYNCTITGNTIKNCGAGIIIQNFKSSLNTVNTSIFDGEVPFNGKMAYDLKTKIYNNNISIVDSTDADVTAGIRVCGYIVNEDSYSAGYYEDEFIPAGNYYIKGVNVKNNIIKTTGWGIDIQDARECIVSGNVITAWGTKKNMDGIFVHASSRNIDVYNNKIINALRNGISVSENSYVKRVYKNTIEKPVSSGIAMYNSRCTGNISTNRITGAGGNAIVISTNSIVKNIYNNIIKSTKGKGISIHICSRVTGEILKNNITDCKETAISVYYDSKVKNIKMNRIVSASVAAIAITDNSTVKSSIAGNVMAKINGYGIFVASAGNNISIDGNIIKSCYMIPIQIGFISSKRVITVKNNNINGNEQCTLICADGGTVNVLDNVLKRGKYAVFYAGNVKGKIGNNKLYKNVYDKYAIYGNKDIPTETRASLKTKITSLKSLKKKTMTLNFKLVKGAYGYVIEYSVKKDFSKSVKIYTENTKKVNIKGLKSNKVYYVRVQPLKDVNGITIYQKQCDVRKVRIK